MSNGLNSYKAGAAAVNYNLACRNYINDKAAERRNLTKTTNSSQRNSMMVAKDNG
jgi:hypothetical protein